MMKNFRKLLAFTLVLAITLCACLPLSLAETSPLEAADKLLGKITITFDKSSYEAGKTVTASYTISGGSGTYKSMDYGVYITNNGITGYFTGDQLTTTTGTIEFTPKFGQEAWMEIWVIDSENRHFNKESDHITLTGGTDPNAISAKLTVDKTTCEVGTAITASYEVTGGSGEYWIAYNCYSFANGSYVPISNEELTAAKGTFTFTPTKGQEAYEIHWQQKGN